MNTPIRCIKYITEAITSSFSRILRRAVIEFASVRRNRGASKTALVSFVVHPFFRKTNSHPNSLELACIEKVLAESGYDVTFIDYRRSRRIKKSFDLCFGFGSQIENLIIDGRAQYSIMYSTGMPAPFQVTQTICAARRIIAEHPEAISDGRNLIRIPEMIWRFQIVASDCILAIGGQEVRRIYSEITDAPVFLVPSISYQEHDPKAILEKKNFSTARQHFLWFGGTGFAHKGLDICIIYFAKNPDLTLHIAGAAIIPKNFQKIVAESPNIVLHGFLGIGSNALEKLFIQCAFILLPSCSEAMATSVVTAVCNGGLIPVVSRFQGFEFGNDIGCYLRELSVECMEQTIRDVNCWEVSRLSETAKNSILYFSSVHQASRFEDVFAEALSHAEAKGLSPLIRRHIM